MGNRRQNDGDSGSKHRLSRRGLFKRSAGVVGAGWFGAGAAGASGDAGSASGRNEGAPMSKPYTIPTWYYQHHDADYGREVPEEGFGAWQKETLAISREHTAVVSMHAWDTGTYEQYPGWWRVVPYIPRANAILRDVYPGLLAAVRASDLPLFHVVGGGEYYKELPGYGHALELAGPGPEPLPKVESDPTREALARFKSERGYPTARNQEDITRGVAKMDFAEPARPLDGEPIAQNGHQLYALCKEAGVNHLIYCGFAINWCLLLSPGGMAEMQKYGLMCSALRQATCAVENHHSARGQLCKEYGLWRVALAYGFVFDVDDFAAAIAP